MPVMSGLSTSQCSDSVVRVKTESMHNIVSLLGTTAEMNEWQLILHSAMIEAQVFKFPLVHTSIVLSISECSISCIFIYFAFI